MAVGPDTATRSDPASAIRPPAARTLGRRSGALLWRYLDIALVLLAAIPALALGAPVFGYVVGAGGWIVQRVIGQADRRWVAAKGATPRTQLGFNLFEAFGRIWLLAGVIIIAGVAGGRADGLTAALIIFGAYSVVFGMRLLGAWPSSTEVDLQR